MYLMEFQLESRYITWFMMAMPFNLFASLEVKVQKILGHFFTMQENFVGFNDQMIFVEHNKVLFDFPCLHQPASSTEPRAGSMVSFVPAILFYSPLLYHLAFGTPPACLSLVDLAKLSYSRPIGRYYLVRKQAIGMAPLTGAWCATFVGDHAFRVFIKLQICLIANSTWEGTIAIG